MKNSLGSFIRGLIIGLLLTLTYILLTGCAGPRGEVGSVGATGPQGAIGSPGHDGSNGHDGRDGVDPTPVTMVQFCPGYTGAYNNFPEFGMNVGGKLYAVYSTADLSFLTRLYPGAYRTTTNATNCNFTVNTDGSLSY